MKGIELHSVDRAAQTRLHEKHKVLIAQLIELASKEPLKLGTIAGLALASAGRAELLHASQETEDFLRTALDALIALFDGVLRQGESIDARVGGRSIRFVGTGGDSTANLSAWVDAFYLATILKAAEALDRLTRIPAGLLRTEGVSAEPFLYEWFETLSAHHANDGSFGRHLVEALRGTDPDGLRFATPEWTLNIAVPEMELLANLGSEDSAKFNDSVRRSIDLHKKYWGVRERKDDPRGFIALGPLAMCSMAHDRGWRITVDTPYLPTRLYAR